MAINTVRRLAADIMHVGENKIRIKPGDIKDVEGALTRADVKGLIAKGSILKLKPQGRASTAKKGRRGHGHRKGTVLDPKGVWMEKIRAQRRFLGLLLESGALPKAQKKIIYRKLKSGIFRNKKAMFLFLKEGGMVAKDLEMPKFAPPHGPHTPAPWTKSAEGKGKDPAAATAQAPAKAQPPAAGSPAAKAPAVPAANTHNDKKGERK